MKKFNQMTEMQMRKTSGGAISALLALLITVPSVAMGGALGTAASK